MRPFWQEVSVMSLIISWLPRLVGLLFYNYNINTHINEINRSFFSLFFRLWIFWCRAFPVWLFHIPNWSSSVHCHHDSVETIWRFILFFKLKWAFLITFCPLSVRSSVCLSVCKLFTFSSSSELGQFYQTWLKASLGVEDIKSHTLFKGEIIAKILK